MKSCVNAELVLIDSDAAGGAVVANSMTESRRSRKLKVVRTARRKKSRGRFSAIT